MSTSFAILMGVIFGVAAHHLGLQALRRLRGPDLNAHHTKVRAWSILPASTLLAWALIWLVT